MVVRGGEGLGIADDWTSRDRHSTSRLELDRWGFQFTNPDLRALQVLNNADWLPCCFRASANQPESPDVLGICAVREIEPRYIHPSLDQSADYLWGVACGPESADDFCLSERSFMHHADSCGHWSLRF